MSTLKSATERKMDKELEVSGSDDLYNKEIERICNDFKEEDSLEIEKYARSLLEERNEAQEPYRAAITNLNFSIVAVLKKLNENLSTPTSTANLYAIDTSEIAKIVENHIAYVNSINDKKRKNLTTEKKKLEKAGGNKQKIKTLSESIEKLKPKKLKPKDIIFDPIKSTDRAKESQIAKAIKFLVAYNVITKVSSNVYLLNMEHWFNHQRYSLNNKRMLNQLLPLLVSFLKYNAPNKVDDFLNHIDKLVGFTIRAPKNHSIFANIENYIIEIINNDDENPKISFEILPENTNEYLNQKTSFIDVDNLQIIFDEEDQKILKFSENKKNYNVAIGYIYFVYVPDATENSMKRKDGNFVIYNDDYAEKIDDKKHKDKVKERIDAGDLNYTSKDYFVIFEADPNMKEYFEMEVFKDTKIYIQEEEKGTFITEELNSILDNPKTLDDFESKILVTGENTIDEILDCAQRNAKNVTLLHPPFIVKKLKEIIHEMKHQYD